MGRYCSSSDSLFVRLLMSTSYVSVVCCTYFNAYCISFLPNNSHLCTSILNFCMQEIFYEFVNFLTGVIMCLSGGGSFPDVMQILELQLVMVVILSTFLLVTTLSIFSNILNIFLSEVCMHSVRRECCSILSLLSGFDENSPHGTKSK